MKSIVKWFYLKIVYGKKIQIKFRNSSHIGNIKIYVSSNSTSQVKFSGNVGGRSYIILNANGGKIFLGDKVFLNNGVRINSHSRVEIGDKTIIGENVLIYDHDHDYHSMEKMSDNFLEAPVIIGKNVWIGSGAIILKGSIIGDNSVIGAGTIVKGIVKENTLVYTKHEKVERLLVD